jgi:hypothetical protein
MSDGGGRSTLAYPSLSSVQPSHELFIPSLLPAGLQKAALSPHLNNEMMKII